MAGKPFKYDIDGLAKDMEVDLINISTLYSEYFFEMRINIQECRDLLSHESWDKLERVIHNIKGISTSLNVDDIYLAANKLDSKLKSGIFVNVDFDINYIDSLFAAAEGDIKEFFKQKNIDL